MFRQWYDNLLDANRVKFVELSKATFGAITALWLHRPVEFTAKSGHWFLLKSASITQQIINQRPDPIDSFQLSKPIIMSVLLVPSMQRCPINTGV
jgi:hypothetical protein